MCTFTTVIGNAHTQQGQQHDADKDDRIHLQDMPQGACLLRECPGFVNIGFRGGCRGTHYHSLSESDARGVLTDNAHPCLYWLTIQVYRFSDTFIVVLYACRELLQITISA